MIGVDVETKNNVDFCDIALKIAQYLSDCKATDVVLLDLKEEDIWTRFFIVATVMSATHAAGLEKQLEEEIERLNVLNFYNKRRANDGNDWKLVDLGEIATIHLMSKISRNFYDLEHLHKNAKKIYDSSTGVI